MKLSDIESKQLLPRFASDISWLMNAFDSVIKPICERVNSIDAPLTLEAIHACTDEELEALYDQYGVAQYYPNLSRETRDLMLFEMCKIYRYLGTPKAIEILCKYIFDNNPIVVKVLDNLSFDDNGVLIDESLLDVFDVNVESQSAFLDEYANARILANIIRFSRNSQFLRYIYYDFPGYFSLPVHPLKAGIASINYENDAICEPVELNRYTFIVADATTGQIVSGFSTELVYGEIEGIVLQSPRLVYGVDISVPTAQFWFTENGRNETENTALQPNNTVTVYDENGDTITDEDTIGMYDTASVLAYMQSDGDMMSKQDDVLIDDNGELGLQVDSGPISAWSVFAERVFTLSFANTQLPGITITMPTDETGHKGTSITLPTMSGEYESGGKTWTPSAWDIGAFGSSYTLNANTVAHLIFVEAHPQEIDIDVNFGVPVTIPEGYDVQSVKSNAGYAFAKNANQHTYSFDFIVEGKDEYFSDTDPNLIGYQIAPCLQLWQPTSFSNNGWTGYYLSSRTSQTPTRVDKDSVVLNGQYNSQDVMLYYSGRSSAVNVNGIIVSAINLGGKALQMRRYDENNVRIDYYFNVPQSLWTFANGVFTWAADVNDFSLLVHWYYFYTNHVRIHCVKSIDIDVNFGDPVTIPAGYSVQSVKCSRGYVFASRVSVSSAQVNYNLPGEKVYFDDTNAALVGVGVKPALTIAVEDAGGSVIAYLSTRPNMSPSPILAQAEKVNSGGSLVKGMAAFSTSSKASSVQSAMQTRPVYFNLTDSADNWLYFCFRVPQTLWQFQNGVFSWLGDITDASGLSYWYNGRSVRIHCIAN